MCIIGNEEGPRKELKYNDLGMGPCQSKNVN